MLGVMYSVIIFTLDFKGVCGMSKEKNIIITLQNGRKREVIQWTTMSGEIWHFKDVGTGRYYSDYDYYKCIRQLEEDLLKDEKASLKNVDVTSDYQRIEKQIISLTKQFNKLCNVENYDYIYTDKETIEKLNSTIGILNDWIIDTVIKNIGE